MYFFLRLWKQVKNKFPYSKYATLAELKIADTYFETHDKDLKGSGWKGYQRWRNANEYKYYPSGNRSNVETYFAENEYERFIANNPIVKEQPNGFGSRSSSGGGTSYSGWKDLGPYRVDSLTGHYSAGMGRIVAVYVDPSDTNTIYVGSRTGGFWKTNDEGANWSVTTDFQVATGVNAIDASPTNSDSVLINILSLNVFISTIDSNSSFKVQKDISLASGVALFGSFFEATNIVVTTSALSNHFPFPEITTKSILKNF